VKGNTIDHSSRATNSILTGYSKLCLSLIYRYNYNARSFNIKKSCAECNAIYLIGNSYSSSPGIDFLPGELILFVCVNGRPEPQVTPDAVCFGGHN
jgi:hypothetical protein